jgi:hypothetical protein
VEEESPRSFQRKPGIFNAIRQTSTRTLYKRYTNTVQICITLIEQKCLRFTACCCHRSFGHFDAVGKKWPADRPSVHATCPCVLECVRAIVCGCLPFCGSGGKRCIICDCILCVHNCVRRCVHVCICMCASVHKCVPTAVGTKPITALPSRAVSSPSSKVCSGPYPILGSQPVATSRGTAKRRSRNASTPEYGDHAQNDGEEGRELRGRGRGRGGGGGGGGRVWEGKERK